MAIPYEHPGVREAQYTIDKIDSGEESTDIRRRRIEELVTQEGHGFKLARLDARYRERFAQIKDEYERNR